jgi:hypothetical protein
MAVDEQRGSLAEKGCGVGESVQGGLGAAGGEGVGACGYRVGLRLGFEAG